MQTKDLYHSILRERENPTGSESLVFLPQTAKTTTILESYPFKQVHTEWPVC